MAKTVTGYWLINCNPSHWDIRSTLTSASMQHRQKITSHYVEKVEPGHLGIIRVGQGGDPPSGIYAIVEFTSTPYPSDRETTVDEDFIADYRILNNMLHHPVLIENLPEDDTLDPALVKGVPGSTHILSVSAFETVLILAHQQQGQL